MAFHFCNHLVEEEIAGYFTLIVFLLALSIVFGALCLFLMMSWVGNAYLFLRYIAHDCFFSFLFN